MSEQPLAQRRPADEVLEDVAEIFFGGGAVETLAVLGPAGVPLLERTRNDKHAVVRGAAVEALARK